MRTLFCRSDESSHSLLEEYDLQPPDEEALSQALSPDEQAWQARSVVATALRRIKGVCVPILFWAIRPAMFVVLRSLVRMKAFWERGLKSCYFDTAKLSSDIVYRYRLPQVCSSATGSHSCLHGAGLLHCHRRM